VLLALMLPLVQVMPATAVAMVRLSATKPLKGKKIFH